MTIRAAFAAAVLAAMALALGACGGGGAKKAATTATTTAKGVTPVSLSVFLRQSFNKADTNHDGVISAAEKDAMVRADYAAMDRNHDGAVTIDDIKTVVAHTKAKAGLDKPLDKHLDFDYNHDGRIDVAEYQRHVAERFGSMDANGDASYTWREVANFYLPTRPRAATSTTTRSDVLGGGVALLLAPFALGRRMRRVAFVVATVALVIVGPAVPAQASAVYNMTSTSYGVKFTCGIFCGSSWQVAPNDWDAYPDESGMYYMSDANLGCEDTTMDGQDSVPDHGYSQLETGGYTGLEWFDFDNNSNQLPGSPVNINVSWPNCND